MQTLPVELLPLIVEFQPFFSKSVWENAQALLSFSVFFLGETPKNLVDDIVTDFMDK